MYSLFPFIKGGLSMGYKEVKDQTGVEKGYVRFEFYIRFKGERYRRVETCRRSAVAAIFRSWEDSITAGTTKQYKFFEIMDKYLEFSMEFKSEKTYRFEKTVINEVVKKFYKSSMMLNDFTRADADAFILWRKKHVIVKYENTKTRGQLANSTINKNIAVLSYFFNWCVKKGYYNQLNPFALQKLREHNYREVMLSSVQLEELFTVAQGISEMFCKTISMLLLTGMRRGELFSLEWSEVNFDTSFIVLSQYKTKSRKRRAIPISPALREILLSIKKPLRLVMGDYTENILAKQWNKLLTQVSFPVINDGTKLRIHDLRHVYSQSLLNQGVSLEDIQSLLGHQSVETTQKRYAQFARPDLLEKGSKIDNVIFIKKVV
jgi:integrase